MDQVPLVDEWKEGGKQFLEEFNNIFPVKTAFWAKDSEESPWYLYIASEKIDAENFDAAYTEVLRTVKKLPFYFDPFRVKILRMDEPMIRAVLAIQDRHPGPFATNYGGAQLGNVSVESAYIYPAPLVAQ